MNSSNSVHAIILTLNEEIHIRRCIDSIRAHVSSITVIDSRSTDNTRAVVTSLGADFLTNPWVNYATQMNYAIDQLSNRGGWLLRIDADEVLDLDSAETINDAINGASLSVNGIQLRRRIHFLNRRIRYGGIEPSWQLRLWRNGYGRCEQRWMDEHIKVEGQVIKSKLILSDINLNSLTWWTEKHNSYASREAIDLLNQKYKFLELDSGTVGSASPQAKRRRWIKNNVYNKLPNGSRALAYFIYRYFIRFGFLDGKAGWNFHVLQGLWYRVLVDGKVAEIEALSLSESIPILKAIELKTGIHVR